MDSTDPDSTPDTPTLVVTGIGKTYAEPVLDDVSLALYPGEALALTGENGAGKSTLSKIVAGLVAPTTGAMRLAGAEYAPHSRAHAEALGVRMVMQELNLVPTLTVAENLFLDRLPHRFGVIDRRRLAADARAAMARVGLDSLDPDTLVGSLGIGHQQMVEIARSLAGDCRVLILDEPTAMLTAREVELLFDQIARLKADGVALVYISHRLEELARVAQRVAVLRDGRLVHVDRIDAQPTERLVALMAGREIAEQAVHGTRTPGAPRLRVERLSRGDAVRDVSFDVRAGEIFGISGLIGAGRTELLRLVYGADAADGGTMSIGDPPRPAAIRSPADAVRHGIALVSEDRKGEGLLLPQSIAANLSLGQLARVARGGVVDGERENALAARQIDALRIRARGPAQPVAELSGGNQQKVAIGRWLGRDMGVLLFDEPTRGIDVGAKFDIYALLDALAREGRAIVVVSSDLRELMLICDRIGVMSAGRMHAVFERGGWTQDALLGAAFAGYARRDAALHPPGGARSAA
ncbi:ABC transporter ATP-binding protein [Burkholderia pseudomallei]|uniref:sugar ABC transporter ATP-binding protein n=1 Tax=Burkholderia TaxID=32008 RepID=UPI000345EB0C|nr:MULTISPECIES: sugar ABC transporter ATP-binding protein [Burkholderia]ANW49048.1 sugar ABC transporter ATP-binding protein [Burkholderia pseudomallei]ANW55084.1 sugar ABC transporter ATP-binding protein [Burkholderia pseudomallei]AYX27970.1 sugar ABC transporter ATP-binding protein [Burkholderia pseudomallei]KGV72647.1 ABC transporter family protein [Burkholderia pseudomallei MSHR3964]KGV88109.1 ABC transporter family protein [Burkholderia pseudomallei MSHR3951]